MAQEVGILEGIVVSERSGPVGSATALVWAWAVARASDRECSLAGARGTNAAQTEAFEVMTALASSHVVWMMDSQTAANVIPRQETGIMVAAGTTSPSATGKVQTAEGSSANMEVVELSPIQEPAATH